MNVKVPTTVGVPLITPADDRFKPEGSVDPDATDQATAPTLSHATIACEYATPTDPSRNVTDVNSVNGATVTVNVRTPMLPSVSCTWIVKLNGPAASGIAAIT